jgi:O-antigen/teichoic acid export membrane protein
MSKDAFGIWVSMTALLAVLFIIDFGIGSGLVNAITEMRQKAKHTTIVDIITNAYIILVAPAAMILGTTVLAWQAGWMDNLAGNVTEAELGDVGAALALTLISIAIFAPLSLIGKIRLAFSEVQRHNMYDMISAIVSALCIAAAAVLNPGLVSMTMALVLPPVLVHAVNTLMFFRNHRELIPRLAAPDMEITSRLVRSGGLFFVMAAASIVSLNLDALLALKVLGPAAAAECGIAIKLVSALQAVISMMMIPYWPAYAGATSSRSASGVRAILWRSLGISLLLAAPPALLIGLAGNDIIGLWISPDAVVNPSLLHAAAIWIPLFAIGASLTACANNAPFIKAQVCILVVGAIAVITVKIMMMRAMGVSGVLWAAVMTYPAFVLIPGLAMIERTLSRWQAAQAGGLSMVVQR